MTKIKASRRKDGMDDVLERKPGVLLVEDDPGNAKIVADHFATYGDFQIHQAASVQKALDIANEFPTLRFVGLDLNLPEKEGGRVRPLAGLVLLREISRILPKAKFYMKTATGFTQEVQAFIDMYKKSVVRTGEGWQPPTMLDKARVVYSDGGMRPSIFIVHGHARDTLDQLRLLIRDDFGLGEPVIMKDAPGGVGHIIIERFEEYAERADLVFALLTPDDETEAGLRARQNVIFEIGYFAAALGRKSGKLILLHHEKAQKPSDMDGLLVIDITGGVRQAADKIRDELKGWWGMDQDRGSGRDGGTTARPRRHRVRNPVHRGRRS
jgi:predicted nucleotide-binding protein